MRRGVGFTIIELMIVVAILGVLAATAAPFYNTFRQRASGSEATVTLRQLVDAEIMYFLEYGRFFPENGDTSITVFHDDPPSKKEIGDIKDALNILVPVDHFLDYHIQTFPKEADGTCTVIISAPFALFRDGSRQVGATVDKEGAVIYF
jgi:prepilin-type N-terminal cleavage/methylation domain-containing protein